MIGSEIREFAAGDGWVAAACFEKNVQIWELEGPSEIAQFPAVFRTGAENLALSPTGRILVTGLSGTRGRVAAYEVPSGKVLWLQNSLRFPSTLRFNADGTTVRFTLDGRFLQYVNAETGAPAGRLEHTRKLFDRPGGGSLRVRAQASGTSVLYECGERVVHLSSLAFPVLDAAFCVDCVCIAEMSGPVRCFDLQNEARERWTFQPENSHVQKLHFSSDEGVLYAISFSFIKGVGKMLLRINLATGSVSTVCALDSWAEVFLPQSEQVLTSSGSVIALRTGEVVKRLPFRQRVYADD